MNKAGMNEAKREVFINIQLKKEQQAEPEKHQNK